MPRSKAQGTYDIDLGWLCDCETKQKAVRRVTKKEGPNKDRAFLCCPLFGDKACGFFVWEDQAASRQANLTTQNTGTIAPAFAFSAPSTPRSITRNPNKRILIEVNSETEDEELSMSRKGTAIDRSSAFRTPPPSQAAVRPPGMRDISPNGAPLFFPESPTPSKVSYPVLSLPLSQSHEHTADPFLTQLDALRAEYVTTRHRFEAMRRSRDAAYREIAELRTQLHMRNGSV